MQRNLVSVLMKLSDLLNHRLRLWLVVQVHLRDCEEICEDNTLSSEVQCVQRLFDHSNNECHTCNRKNTYITDAEQT